MTLHVTHVFENETDAREYRERLTKNSENLMLIIVVIETGRAIMYNPNIPFKKICKDMGLEGKELKFV